MRVRFRDNAGRGDLEGVVVGYVHGVEPRAVVAYHHVGQRKNKLVAVSLGHVEVLDMPPTDGELADYLRARRALET